MEQEIGSRGDYGRHHSVEVRAYRLWEERGQPLGTPEIDWFRAERELVEPKENVVRQSSAVAAAKVVGSVLGSVAGLVTSVTGSIAAPEPKVNH